MQITKICRIQSAGHQIVLKITCFHITRRKEMDKEIAKYGYIFISFLFAIVFAKGLFWLHITQSVFDENMHRHVNEERVQPGIRIRPPRKTGSGSDLNNPNADPTLNTRIRNRSHLKFFLLILYHKIIILTSFHDQDIRFFKISNPDP